MIAGKKHLVLIGGGHAHMAVMARIGVLVGRGHRVTVIQPSIHHYYSGMGPGMLAGTYAPDQIRFDTRDRVTRSGGAFVLDRVVRIDADDCRVRLAGGESIAYDVLGCNAGSHVPVDAIADSRHRPATVKPIESLIALRERIVNRAADPPMKVLIVGGGPSAMEVAGNIRQLVDAAVCGITVVAGRRMLDAFPPAVRRRVVSVLRRRAVTIVEGERVAAAGERGVQTDAGNRFEADVVVAATGVRPSPIFERSGLPTGPDGGLRVNRCLQCTGHGNIFGGGDCIHFEPSPLDKVGVYAVRQNPVLYHNLLASLEGAPLTPFDPGGKDYLLIMNLGGGIGVFHKGPLTFSGRLAFHIKDLIDRRFIRRYR